MRDNIAGMNEKWLKSVPLICLFLVLLPFLAFVNIEEAGIAVSGYQMLAERILAFSNTGTSLATIGFLFILGLPLVLMIVSLVLIIAVSNRKIMKIVVACYSYTVVMAVLFLFTSKKLFDASGIFSEGFMIKDLGIGYWIYLALCFVGLIASMKTMKISPGYIVLVIMSIIWLFPIMWVILISFRGESGSFTSYFWPKELTFKNYQVLLTDNSQFYYVKWFGNTLFVAICSCILSTFIVLSTAFILSRIRFQGRKTLMNLLLILGMFPGFMSMIAVYYILKGMGLTQSLIALIIVYSSGGALGYYIAKGFFDTIPKALDEAAYIDGATKFKVFTKITIPLSKPIIIYTVLTSFMGPWADFIFARIIMGDDYEHYTIALGLFTMLERNNIDTWYTRFAAGAVLVSIPIAVLFISLQKYYVEGVAGSVKG